MGDCCALAACLSQGAARTGQATGTCPSQHTERISWGFTHGYTVEGHPQASPALPELSPVVAAVAKVGVSGSVLLALAENLCERDKLDLRDAFVDGTFAPAKIGEPPLVTPSVARAPGSWQWQTLLVFLSPCAWSARRPTRRPWWKVRWSAGLPKMCPNTWLRQGLRQRCLGCPFGTALGHRGDRTHAREAQSHPRWPPPAALLPPLEGGTPVCWLQTSGVLLQDMNFILKTF